MRIFGIATLVAAGLLVAYYVLPAGVVVASLGEVCPYSPAGTHWCTKDTSGHDRCVQPGIRFVGRTARRADSEEAEVCFTLTPDRRSWLEITYLIECADGTILFQKYKCPTLLGHPGRIASSDFTATIRGSRAGGVVWNPYACKGRNAFRWNARQRAA